ncbi:hypothetical protein BpHYR1_049202 [Brachionus plicatilis]|uniref:Uncharacterized protein n=1 Tax=Brachionus plicatilis TaxID=10195 RepID=A0A3M7PHS4_BRAPC|nr:hypothetical protein BpHYR1_049202 [Brachionus plicatilis]
MFRSTALWQCLRTNKHVYHRLCGKHKRIRKRLMDAMSTNSACSTGSVASPALINSVSQLIQTAMINPSSPNSSVLVPAQGSAQIFFNSQEGRTYKKEKQIVLEFEAKSKASFFI